MIEALRDRIDAVVRCPPLHPGLIDTLAERFRERRALVVLDNCEHVTAGAAELAMRMGRENWRTWLLAFMVQMRALT